MLRLASNSMTSGKKTGDFGRENRSFTKRQNVLVVLRPLDQSLRVVVVRHVVARLGVRRMRFLVL